MINTTGITGLYTSLTDAIASKLDALYTADKIDAETYAKIMAQSFDDALKLSVSAVQQQEQIEKDAALKDAQIAQTTQQTSNLMLEADNITKQGLLLAAQTTVQEQQIINMAAEKLRTDAQTSQITAETLNVPKQGLLIDAQKEVQLQQKLNLVSEELRVNAQTAQIKAETLNTPKQGMLLDAQKENIIAEGYNISKLGSKINADAALVTQQKVNLISEELGIGARTALTTQQKDNAAIENTVLVAQECKLRAEYDSIMTNNLRVASEKALLDQKLTTEKAQTTTGFVDGDSVLGKQKALYEAQASGYKRDAEQKAAEIMFKSWATRKTTDDATTVNSMNKLEDQYIGTAITKLLAGIGG